MNKTVLFAWFAMWINQFRTIFIWMRLSVRIHCWVCPRHDLIWGNAALILTHWGNMTCMPFACASSSYLPMVNELLEKSITAGEKKNQNDNRIVYNTNSFTMTSYHDKISFQNYSLNNV